MKILSPYIIKNIKKYNIKLKIENNKIFLKPDLSINHSNIVIPFFQKLLEKISSSYFTVVFDVPACLLPNFQNHITYSARYKRICQKNNNCAGCKHVLICPGWPTDFNLSKTLHSRAINDLPNEIVVEITNQCNQACLHCSKRNNKTQLALGSIKKIVDECAKNGITAIRFTGGEPLLYKYLEPALEFAKAKKLYVILNSNLANLNEKQKKILKKYVDNILVSLQGFDPTSDQYLTGTKMNFAEKLRNISDLTSLIKTVRVGTVISRTLLENRSKYELLIDKMRIKNWEFYRPILQHAHKEYNISKDDIINMMFFLKKIKKDGTYFKISNAVPFCIVSDFDLCCEVLLGAKADDGHSRIIFDCGGYFKPSYFINENLGGDMLRAWTSPFIKKIHSFDYLPLKCKNCFYLSWCKGGSRYFAKLKHNSYFSADPLMAP